MRYFKLTDSTGLKTEYIKVADLTENIATKSETTTVIEISEEDYNLIMNPRTSKLDLYMPTISY